MEFALRPVWNRIFKFDWVFGLVLLLIICVPRFFLVLHANETGNYRFIGFIMLASALVPFIFLSKLGRKQIGLKKSSNLHFVILAFLFGIIGSLLLYVLGKGLFGNSFENWYVYIGKSYNIPTEITSYDKKIMFLIMAITGMTFSPIGEEFFFRGIVHGSFANSLGDKKASIVDSLAFALTHVSHFGLIFINGKWSFFLLPALLWVTCMFLISALFFWLKTLTQSLWGAVFCHAGFNLGMIFCIFYLL